MKRHAPNRSGRRSRERGVVLLFSLIALVIMLLAAVALVRSFNSSLFTAGNIAFKRDMQNQSERAVDKALTEFRSGGSLDTPAKRAANLLASNYSATMLAVNAQGIPDALQNDTTFAVVGTGADLKSTDQSVAIRYVIDRLCSTAGDETTLGSSGCLQADSLVPAGTSSSNLQGPERSLGKGTPAGAQGVVFRLSVKVTGPRSTQSFFQSTFTVPSS